MCLHRPSLLANAALTIALTAVLGLTHSVSAAETKVQATKKAKPPLAQRVARATPAPQALAVIEELSSEQKTLALRVVSGSFPCAQGARVELQPDARHEGRFILALGKQSFSMVPVATDSGAVRLEDAAHGGVWLQLANKSMLLHQKQGRRLADDCMTAEQARVAAAMERDPASHLLEGQPEGRRPAAGVAVAEGERIR